MQVSGGAEIHLIPVPRLRAAGGLEDVVVGVEPDVHQRQLETGRAYYLAQPRKKNPGNAARALKRLLMAAPQQP